METNFTDGFTVEYVTGLLSVWGLKALAALAIFIIGKWVAKALTGVCRQLLKKSKVDATLVSFLGNIVYALLMAFVVIAAISNLGVETASLVGLIAAAGLAVGLALQGSLANFAAGVMIIMFRPFKVGDFVEVAGTLGVVDDINIFTTHLKSPDNKAVIVPNGSITSGVITNFNALGTRRIDLLFSISYGDDIKKAKTILEEIVKGDQRILPEPAPFIGVTQLGDSSVDIACRPWVNAADWWQTHCDLLEAVKARFDAEGLTIPFPQQEVRMFSMNENKPQNKAA